MIDHSLYIIPVKYYIMTQYIVVLWQISYPMKKKNGLMISLDQKIFFHPVNGEWCQENFKLKMGI